MAQRNMIGRPLFAIEPIGNLSYLHVVIFEISKQYFIIKPPACWGADVSIEIHELLLLFSIITPWWKWGNPLMSKERLRWYWCKCKQKSWKILKIEIWMCYLKHVVFVLFLEPVSNFYQECPIRAIYLCLLIGGVTH